MFQNVFQKCISRFWVMRSNSAPLSSGSTTYFPDVMTESAALPVHTNRHSLTLCKRYDVNPLITSLKTVSINYNLWIMYKHRVSLCNPKSFGKARGKIWTRQNICKENSKREKLPRKMNDSPQIQLRKGSTDEQNPIKATIKRHPNECKQRFSSRSKTRSGPTLCGEA